MSRRSSAESDHRAVRIAEEADVADASHRGGGALFLPAQQAERRPVGLEGLARRRPRR